MSTKNFFHKKTVRDIPLDGQTVLLRTDYNVPLDSKGVIADDYRISQSLPTLHYLLDTCQAGVVIISHLGRPNGEVNEKYSLALVAAHLQKLLGRKVTFIKTSVGDQVAVATKKLKPGEVIMLENLRFHSQEEANDTSFAQSLARDSHACYFVQDGFGVVHRAHASTSAITHYLPSVGGLLLEREYQHILGAVLAPKLPLVAILGGAKIADKIELIDAFIPKADHIIIGGAMANTFLDYKGCAVGKSLIEPHEKPTLDRIYKDAAKKVGLEQVDEFVVLPTDVAVAEKIEARQPRKEVTIDNVHAKEMILDLGIDSVKQIEKLLRGAGTVVWNGTLGYAELSQFQFSSAHVAAVLANQPRTISVIGGGDTADFVLDWDGKKGGSFTHVSTGGGASLELMAGKKLPGVEALL